MLIKRTMAIIQMKTSFQTTLVLIQPPGRLTIFAWIREAFVLLDFTVGSNVASSTQAFVIAIFNKACPTICTLVVFAGCSHHLTKWAVVARRTSATKTSTNILKAQNTILVRYVHTNLLGIYDIEVLMEPKPVLNVNEFD